MYHEYVYQFLIILNCVINIVSGVLFLDYTLNDRAGCKELSFLYKNHSAYKRLFKGKFYRYTFTSIFLIIILGLYIISVTDLYFLDTDTSAMIAKLLLILCISNILILIAATITLIFMVISLITSEREISTDKYIHLKNKGNLIAKNLLLKHEKIIESDMFMIEYCEELMTNKNKLESENEKVNVKNEIKRMETTRDQIDNYSDKRSMPIIVFAMYFFMFLFVALPLLAMLISNKMQ